MCNLLSSTFTPFLNLVFLQVYMVGVGGIRKFSCQGGGDAPPVDNINCPTRENTSKNMKSPRKKQLNSIIQR
ncbi:hypothetical protein ACS0TY_000154 [Phlomoides rotata]